MVSIGFRNVAISQKFDFLIDNKLTSNGFLALGCFFFQKEISWKMDVVSYG